MSDTPTDPPQLPQRFLDAWNALQAFDREAWKGGYDAGWRDGWDAGIRMILERLPKAPPAPSEPAKVEGAANQATAPPPATVASAMKADVPSASTKVLAIIKRTPGLRGVEILQLLRDEDPKILERTMRTGLYRHKKAGSIKIVDGRWYATEAAPANPQPTFPEG